MLTADAALVGAASAGLGGMLTGTLDVPVFGLAALGLVALFIALVAALSPAGEAEEADSTPEPLAGLSGLTRRGMAACALVLGAIGALSGAMAVAVWDALGPTQALGLGAVALGFLALAVSLGLRALRSRAR